MKLINNTIKLIVCFCILVSTILTVIDFCCFDKNFYYNQYQKNNTIELIQTNQEELVKITNNLLDYLKDKNDDINIKYIKNGIETNVYQDIEIIHMSDVKDLYKAVMTIRLITLIISIIGLLFFIIFKTSIKKEFSITIMFVLIVLMLIGINCIIDFNSFWISFHKLFFTKNDYWLLDPRTCILVNLFTSNFFFSLCTKICIISAISIFVIYLLISVYEKKAYH